MMNAICLVVDRLHIGYLGAYGNDWGITPELDRLACDGFVWDQATIDSPELPRLYRGYWQGLHALSPAAAESGCATLVQVLSGAGVETALLTDEPDIANLAAAVDFGEVVRLAEPRPPRLVGDVGESRFAELFAEAADWIATARQPFLLWMHSRGMAGPWDAPLALRNQFADDESLPASDATLPPARTLPPTFDPDELLPIRWAYAGQVALLDQCVGALLESLQAASLAETTLVAVLSARGFPLGEHLRVGPWPETGYDPGAGGGGHALPRTLYTELIHVPWLMRFPQEFGAGGRSQALAQPMDLPATLMECWRLDRAPLAGWGRSLMPIVREETDSIRDRACAVTAGGERSIRTAAWRLRWSPADQDPHADAACELFVKPDDFWEVNNVADRCADLVQPLQQAFDAWGLGQCGDVMEAPALDPKLASGPD